MSPLECLRRATPVASFGRSAPRSGRPTRCPDHFRFPPNSTLAQSVEGCAGRLPCVRGCPPRALAALYGINERCRRPLPRVFGATAPRSVSMSEMRLARRIAAEKVAILSAENDRLSTENARLRAQIDPDAHRTRTETEMQMEALRGALTSLLRPLSEQSSL